MRCIEVEGEEEEKKSLVVDDDDDNNKLFFLAFLYSTSWNTSFIYPQYIFQDFHDIDYFLLRIRVSRCLISYCVVFLVLHLILVEIILFK